MSRTSPHLSVVVPLYNEEGNVEPLIESLKAFASRVSSSVEFLLVNDGSTDGTGKRLRELQEKDLDLRCFHFRTNLGKSACYNLGFEEARGKILATMDGDLQDDPMDMLPMLEKIETGADFVTGWKHRGKSVWYKSFLSKLFNLYIRWNTKLQLHDINCPLKVFKRECVTHVHLQGELFRFLPLLVSYMGFKVEECKVKSLPRLQGSTKFGTKRYFQAFFDFFSVIFLHRFKEKPMHFFGAIGVTTLFCGLFIDGFLTIRGLFFTDPPRIGHHAMLLLGVLLILMGAQFLLFGFLATLLSEKKKKDVRLFLD